MPYDKTDELAINTIRTLAVRCPVLPRRAPRAAPPLLAIARHCPLPHLCRRDDGCSLATLHLLLLPIADLNTRPGRCHLPGQLRPPGRPYGHGPGGPRPVQQVHDFQPQEPRLGQPRSFRPLVRVQISISLPIGLLHAIPRHAGVVYQLRGIYQKRHLLFLSSTTVYRIYAALLIGNASAQFRCGSLELKTIL
jgi:hypothetical protein